LQPYRQATRAGPLNAGSNGALKDNPVQLMCWESGKASGYRFRDGAPASIDPQQPFRKQRTGQFAECARRPWATALLPS